MTVFLDQESKESTNGAERPRLRARTQALLRQRDQETSDGRFIDFAEDGLLVREPVPEFGEVGRVAIHRMAREAPFHP